MFALLQHEDGSIEHVNAAVLWDLEPAATREPSPTIRELMKDRTAMEDYLIADVLLPYRNEIAERREHDAEIKRRYGVRSLEYLISESNGKLVDYESRAASGESMDIVIRNERRRLEEFERRQEELEKEIVLESNLTVSEPRILGVAAVMPKAQYEVGDTATSTGSAPQARETQHGGMVRDEEVEAVGMRVARRYEEGEGWEVDDVSAEPHGGFDLRSVKYDEHGGVAGVRYVEVKARAQTGAIRLTANEWKKARHFGPSYWLYVVTGAGTDEPSLERIQNPAAVLREDEDIFATGFIIPEEKWRGHSGSETEGSEA